MYDLFGVNFVKGVRSKSRFTVLYVSAHLFQHYLWKRLSSFHCIAFNPFFSEINLLWYLLRTDFAACLSFFFFKYIHSCRSEWKVKVLVTQSCLTLCESMDLACQWNFPGKSSEVGIHFLLQGIFLTQGSNPQLLHLLHCKEILYNVSHQGHWVNSSIDCSLCSNPIFPKSVSRKRVQFTSLIIWSLFGS